MDEEGGSIKTNNTKGFLKALRSRIPVPLGGGPPRGHFWWERGSQKMGGNAFDIWSWRNRLLLLPLLGSLWHLPPTGPRENATQSEISLQVESEMDRECEKVKSEVFSQEVPFLATWYLNKILNILVQWNILYFLCALCHAQTPLTNLDRGFGKCFSRKWTAMKRAILVI